MRLIWIMLGLLSLALAILGIPLPLLPTVPFLLLSAFFFARSSKRLHDWLLNHPKFGPPILDWQKRGAIRRRVKYYASASIVAAFLLALAFGVPTKILIIQVISLVGVALFIWTRPEA